jgi:hypothetical protein
MSNVHIYDFERISTSSGRQLPKMGVRSGKLGERHRENDAYFAVIFIFSSFCLVVDIDVNF